MKHLCFRMGLVSLLACGLIAVCSSSAVAQDAAATYKAKNCAMCHGADGKGRRARWEPMTSRHADVKADRCPAHGHHHQGQRQDAGLHGKLTDADIKDLVAYIRTLGKK